MAHATSTDVATLLMRPMSDVEIAFAEKLLTLATATLRKRITGLDERMSTDPEFDAIVNYVESSALARLLRNPEGLSYEVIGAYAIQRPQGGIGGGFAFNDEELALVGLGQGAFTIRPHLAPASYADLPLMPPWWYDFPTSDGSL